MQALIRPIPIYLDSYAMFLSIIPECPGLYNIEKALPEPLRYCNIWSEHCALKYHLE